MKQNTPGGSCMPGDSLLQVTAQRGRCLLSDAEGSAGGRRRPRASLVLLPLSAATAVSGGICQ